MGSLSSTFSSMAASTGSMILGLILKIPELLNGVASLADTITDFPNALFKAFGNLFDSLISLVADFIPNLIQSVVKSIFQSADFITGIVDAFVGLLDTLPDMIIDMLDQLPEAIVKIIVSVISGIGKLVSVIFRFIVKGIPRLIKGIIKAIPDIIFAIFRGVKDGFKSAFGDLDKKISNGFNKAGKKLREDFDKASELFKVSDLGDSRFSDQEDKANKLIEDIKEAMSWLEMKWKEIWNWANTLWKKMWNWADEKWKEIWNFAEEKWKEIWNWLDEKWKGIWNWAVEKWRGMWNWADEKWKGMWTFLSEGLQSLWDKSFGKLSFDGLQQAWDDSFGKLSAAGMKQTLKDLGKALWEGLNPQSLIDKLFPKQGDTRGTVEKILSKAFGSNFDIPVLSFAQGTRNVPGTASVPGDSMINDKILALLSPGESVIPRSKMKDPGVRDIVDNIMSGNLKPMKLAGGLLGQAQTLGGKISDQGKKVVKVISDPKTAIWDKYKDAVMSKAMQSAKKLVENFSFDNGGRVSGDGVAQLHKNEIVLAKPMADDLGNLLKANLKQSQNSGETVINVAFNIKTSDKIDDKFIRDRVWPEFKVLLRRDSLDGKRLIERSGIG